MGARMDAIYYMTLNITCSGEIRHFYFFSTRKMLFLEFLHQIWRVFLKKKIKKILRSGEYFRSGGDAKQAIFLCGLITHGTQLITIWHQLGC